VSYHYFPVNLNLCTQWKEALTHRADIERLSHYSTVCSVHFKTEDFSSSSTRRMLLPGAVPSIFTGINDEFSDFSEKLPLKNVHVFCDSETQTTISSVQIKNLVYTNRCLEQKLKRMQIRYNKVK
ncbi:unnamed protein product, partial [Tenebrio molitor]